MVAQESVLDDLAEPVDLDPVIHAVSRLRIMTALASLADDATITFSRFRQVLGMTPGNLQAQLQTLAAAHYVALVQRGKGRGSTTWISITPLGRAAYEHYSRSMMALLDSSRLWP